MAKKAVYTVGHSTRPLEEFIRLLASHGIETLVDVRTIPRSRRLPHYNESALAASLPAHGIRYVHIAELGGLRKTHKDSPNTGWRNVSFRGYADYMMTEEFVRGLDALEAIARKSRTAIMCAEAVPWRCHRSLIADALQVRGWAVYDIMTTESAPAHKPTPFLKVEDGRLTYPPPAGPLL